MIPAFGKIKRVKVVAGTQRGRKIGIPTINLDPARVNLKEGIYACRVFSKKPYFGVLHFGPRPTFGEKSLSLEAHLFDFDKETVLPLFVDLEIYSFIRGIKNFDTVDLMVRQIKNDITIAKRMIKRLSLKS